MSDATRHIYVHVPFCGGKCAYCAFYSEKYSSARAVDWLTALVREFEMRLNQEGVPSAEPETIYCGGGTPGLLPPAELARLCDILLSRISKDRLREWTVETNPGTLNREGISVLSDAGVNRVSIGVQSFDDAILARLGRRHTASQTAETFALLREGGIDNIGIDLIASLPEVDSAAWRNTLCAAVDLDPAHVSVYTLSAEPGTGLWRQVQACTLRLPDADSQLRALAEAELFLRESGYERYEISNYAKPGRRCLHNLACWRGEDYLGLGPAAATRAGRLRRNNAPDLDGYLKALNKGEPPPAEEEELTAVDDVAERMVFALRSGEGLDPRDFIEKYGEAAARTAPEWEDRLAYLSEQGLAKKTGHRWVATTRGWELADTIAAVLWCG